jgi:hypothetical protein
MMVGFIIGLFNSQYISIMGLFSLYFAIALMIAYLAAAVSWLKYETLSIEWIVTLVFTTCLTVSFYGGYTAQQQAYYSKTKYSIVTKSGAFSDVRMVRTSSSGFLISSEKIIMFVPAGEVRYIATLAEQ